MRHLMLALPLLLGFVQDEAAIRDLIRKLDDTDLEVRDKALTELTKAGRAALELLRQAEKSESAEVRARATQAIRVIESQLKAKEVYPEYKPLPLKKSGTVGEILDELAKQSGAKFEVAAELRQLKGSVDATSLFQALDQLCSAQEKLTYTLGDDGSYRFAGEPHSSAPAAYFEAFKVLLTRTSVQRDSDFKKLTVAAQISIATLWEGRLKPLKRVRYEFTEAKDEAGRAIEVLGAADIENQFMAGGAGFVFRMLGAAGGGAGEEMDFLRMFELKGISPEAKSLAVLKGRAIVSFPHPPVGVEFKEPESGTTQTVGDVVVKVKKMEISKNRVSLLISKAKGDGIVPQDEVLGRLESGSVVAVDEDGQEHAGEIMPAANEGGGMGMIVIGGPGGGPGGNEQDQGQLYYAKFADLNKKDIKSFRFRFSDALFEKSVPFEIKGVKLP